jgi:S1-C subfamily serine protease
MKTKILAIMIILCSIISWMIWSFFVIKFLPDIKNKDILTKKIDWFEEKISKIWESNQLNSIVNSNQPMEDIENNIINLIKNTSPSVVSIIIKKDLMLYKSDPWWFFVEQMWKIEKKVWWWTWFFVTKSGLIITNKHVISDKEAEYTVITNDEKEYSAKVVWVDPLNDLAILKINWDNFIPLNFIEDEDEIKLWQFAIAIWNALAEFQNSVSFWVVSWKNRSIKDENIALSNLIQTDTAINPWNSWGPLLNTKWQVMWINTAIVNGSQSIWFSISLNKKKVDYIINSIEKFWKIKRPFIWINYVLLSESMKESLWVKVDDWAFIIKDEWWVIKNSNADKAGLEWWDIIQEIDWNKISLENDLNKSIQDKLPWDKIKLKILKQDWKIKDIDLILWEI